MRLVIAMNYVSLATGVREVTNKLPASKASLDYITFQVCDQVGCRRSLPGQTLLAPYWIRTSTFDVFIGQKQKTCLTKLNMFDKVVGKVT